MTVGQNRQHDHHVYCWAILVVSVAILFIMRGRQSTFSVFLKLMIADVGWMHGMILLVVAVNIWLSGFLQPLTGYMMDRYGAKWFFAGSVAIFGLGTGLTYSVGYLLVIYGIVVVGAAAGASIAMTNALVVRWFLAERR